MQTPIEFFQQYQKNHRFVFNKNSDLHKEFERLAIHMNWPDAAYYLNKKKFLKFFSNPAQKTKENNANSKESNPKQYFLHSKENQSFRNKETFSKTLTNQTKSKELKHNEKPSQLTPQDYFLHYQRFHKFDYLSQNNKNNEFERLAEHMNWREMQYVSHKNKFLEILKQNHENNNNIIGKRSNQIIMKTAQNYPKFQKENTNKIEKDQPIPHNLFVHYQKNHNFHYNCQNEQKNEFERLAEHMNWRGLQYNNEKKRFLQIFKKSKERNILPNSYNSDDGDREILTNETNNDQKEFGKNLKNEKSSESSGVYNNNMNIRERSEERKSIDDGFEWDYEENRNYHDDEEEYEYFGDDSRGELVDKFYFQGEDRDDSQSID